MTRDRTPRKRRATYDDILAAPENLVAELIDGELFLSPRPKMPHAIAGSVLGAFLLPRFHLRASGPGGWLILDEPEVHLGEDVVVPDLAGWLRSRRPGIDRENYPTLAPDWLCEVLSPSTMRLDRTKKLKVYARAGVRHVWLVDPLERTVEVMSLQEKRWQVDAVYSQHDRMRAAPFEAQVIPLSELWDEVPPQG